MRSRFDEQLELLNVELIRMGALCEDAISFTVQAMMGERNLIEQVYAVDREIDQKEKDIESLCLRLLLRQQPVARDFRKVSSALKMISDMERIGDQAADIAEIITYLQDQDVASRLHIRDMANATILMVTRSIDSFVKKDLQLAHEVIAEDDIVDDLFDKVKAELIDLISADPANGEYCIDMLMIAKYFERIGDHATNIAEWVVFAITGVHAEE